MERRGKKGAIQLSMNTIVIVVLSLVFLVLFLLFIRGVFSKLFKIGF